MNRIHALKTASTWVVFASVALNGAAQDNTVPRESAQLNKPSLLGTIVVEGRQEPSLTVPSINEAVREISGVPGGANVVNAEEYKIGRSANLKDALDFAPGVYVQPRFGSEEARISIRGSGIQRTFHGRGLTLLQDGVPLNLADGGFDMQAVEPLATSYIEVFRGANALRYGAASLGGAVNFVSPTGHDASLAQARAEAGSFGYVRGQVSSGGVHGMFDYYATVTHFSQDGFRDHSAQNNQRVFSNYGVRLSDEVENRTWVTYVHTDSELPGSLTKAQLYANPEQANPAQVIGDNKRDFDLFRLANRTAWQRDQHRAELSAWWSHKDLDHPIFQVIDQNSNDLGLDARYGNQGELMGRRNELTVGFRPTYGVVQDARYLNVAGNRGALVGNDPQTSYNLDFYAEDQFWAEEDFALVLAAQMSYASREFEDEFLTDGNQTDEQTYFALNPKFGAIWQAATDIQLYGNLSRSFESPSFGELVRPPGAGVVNGLVQLDAQTAWTFELGTRGERGRFAWDVAWYYSLVDGELLALGLPGGPTTTVNAEQTIHTGIELGFNVTLLENILGGERDGAAGDSIVWRNAYLWNRFRFNGDMQFGDNQLPGIPEHYYRTEIVYQHSCGLYAGINVEWSPGDIPVDLANTLYADGYALLGARAGYRTARGFSVFVDVRNLTDEIYSPTTGVVKTATPATAAFLPGDGLAFYGGIEWSY